MHRADSHLDRARQLMELARHADAERELRAALALEPDHPFAHALLAICLGATGRYAEAHPSAERALTLAPDLPFVHYVRAMLLLGDADCHWRSRPAWRASLTRDTQRVKSAEAALREALRLDPDDPDALRLLAIVLAERGRASDALIEAERALALDPENSGLILLRAELLRKLGRRDDAEAMDRHALAIDPDDAEAHVGYGWSLMRRGKAAEAAGHFREALRIDPRHADARRGFHHAVYAMHPVVRWFTRANLWMDDLSRWKRWAIFTAGPVAIVLLIVLAAVDARAMMGVLLLGPVLLILVATLVYAFTPTPDTRVDAPRDGEDERG